MKERNETNGTESQKIAITIRKAVATLPADSKNK